MSDEVNEEAINKEFVQEFQRCYVEGDESSRRHCTRVPVNKRALKLISSLAIFYSCLVLASFLPFQFCNPQSSKIVTEDYLGLATTSLHNMDVYVTPYSSKGFKLFQPFK